MSAEKTEQITLTLSEKDVSDLMVAFEYHIMHIVDQVVLFKKRQQPHSFLLRAIGRYEDLHKKLEKQSMLIPQKFEFDVRFNRKADSESETDE